MPAINQIASPETKNTKASALAKSRKRQVEVSSDLINDSLFDKRVLVPGWKKLQQDMEKDLLLFKLTESKTLKVEWETLSDNTQKAFTEVLNTVKNKGEHDDAETDGECFVFGFSDDDVNLSAVCTVLNGKTAFFYKEVC